MTKFLNNRKRKYLTILPFVFLILNAFYYMHASDEIQNTLLQEKYEEITNAVDMLAAAVEANPERVWQEHEHNIRDSVEFMDQLYQLYAGAYKLIDKTMPANYIDSRHCSSKALTKAPILLSSIWAD